jgi:hypothetical protein
MKKPGEIVVLGDSSGGRELCHLAAATKAPDEGWRRRSFKRDEPEAGRVDSWASDLGRQHRSPGHEKVTYTYRQANESVTIVFFNNEVASKESNLRD